MKKIKFILLFVIILFSIDSIYAQVQGSVRVTKSSTAKRLIEFRLKNVEGVTAKQIDELVKIDVKIDEEIPFLETFSSNAKKEIEKSEQIYALKKKLYANVLNEKQMEQYKIEIDKIMDIMYKRAKIDRQKPTGKKKSK